MYGKIFRQIYNSSIANNWKTRVVFMDLIVLADSDGVVDMTVEALSRITNIPIDMVKEAVSELELNDPESRSTELDGRRIVKLDSSRSWGWKIVNYERYRNTHTESDRRENSYYGSTTKNSYVYYAVSGNEVKIGCSVNPWSRVYELKTGRPDIVLAAVENGGKDVEIERHRQFSRHLINREWFRLDGDLKSFIEKLEQEHLDSKLRKSNSSKNSSEIVADPSPSPCTYRSSSSEGGTGGNGWLGPFNEFWEAYPKKVKKFDAQHAFSEVKGQDIIKEILAAIERQKRWESWTKEGGMYIPCPSNWLRDGRWNDKQPETGYKKSIL